MTTLVRYNFWLDADKREALRTIKRRDGISESEQLRRAVDAWLVEKGISKTVAPKRACANRP